MKCLELSKFEVGATVRIRRDADAKHRVPDRLDFTYYEKSRPRTIIAIRYNQTAQCNYYRLGSNGKGKLKDGQPLEGFDYWFRSYHLEHYTPRKYGKRKYTMKANDNRRVI